MSFRTLPDDECSIKGMACQSSYTSKLRSGKYDAKRVQGGSDNNPTESKNIEYSLLSEKIDKLQTKLSQENSRTIQVISKVDDSKLRGMLYGHYINRLSWRKVGEQYYYGKSRSYDYRGQCLNAVCRFVPREVVV